MAESPQSELIRTAINRAALVVVTEGDGTIAFANIKYLQAVGRTLDELTAERVRLIDPAIHPAELIDEIRRTIKHGETWRGEICARSRDGKEIWMDLSLVPFPKPGEPPKYVAIGMDVTARHEIEERLRQSEANLAASQRIAHLGSWQAELKDLEKTGSSKQQWSDEVFRIFGHEPHSIPQTADEFYRAVHPEDRERIKKAVRRALTTGTEYEMEHRIIRPDGEVRLVEAHAEVVHDETQPWPWKMVGTIRDITEGKQTESALRETEEQLRQSQRIEAVGKLAGGVAHDFNNLLAVIMLHTDLMLTRLPKDDPQRRRVDEIRDAADRAASLTRQLLAFSRAQVMQPRIVELNSVVSDTARMLRRVIGEDIELQIRLLPGSDRVVGDPDQLVQVLLNLAVNSRDAMPRGGTLTIETTHVAVNRATAELPAGNYAVLSVRDTGHGMSPETKERVFEPFFSTHEPGHGSGLGLSTVYGIVRQSGGVISVESEPGRGTTFRIYLPVVEAVEEIEAAAETSLPTGSETVLVVEDEDQVRRVACEVLSLYGYQVVAAGHGGEAISLVRNFSGPIHLLLTDVIMPKMGGPELVQELQRLRPGLRVLFMSGYMGNKVDDQGVDRAGAEFIAKPFSRGDLARRVREVLDSQPSLVP